MERPDVMCAADTKGSATYREMMQMVYYLSEMLRAEGVKEGDPVVVECTQDRAYLALYLAMPNPLRCTLPGELPPTTKNGRRHEPMSRDRSRALSRRDILPLLLVTLLYAFAAFFRLGSTAAPQSFVPMEGQEATIELPEGVYPSRILLYPGVGMGSYALEFSEDGEAWEHAAAFSQDHIAVLKWAELSPSSALRPRWAIRATQLTTLRASSVYLTW